MFAFSFIDSLSVEECRRALHRLVDDHPSATRSALLCTGDQVPTRTETVSAGNVCKSKVAITL